MQRSLNNGGDPPQDPPTAHKEAYAAVAVRPTGILLDYQNSLCARFNLLPRPEFHITLAFLGTVPDAVLRTLNDVLLSQRFQYPLEIEVSGLGMAARDDNGKTLLPETDTAPFLAELPTVAWIRVADHPVLLALKNFIAQNGSSLGFSTSFIRDYYDPHITLGSGCRKDPQPWALWDVHDVRKKTFPSALAPPFRSVQADKYHLTTTAIHPKSLYCFHSNE
jgi:2'-5' RNA ligase